VRTYLASLSTDKSRRTALESVQRVARAAEIGDWRTIPWGRMTARETLVVRMRLLQEHSPVTVKLTLSVLRGVLKSAFRLGQMTADELARATDWPKLRASKIARGRALTDEEIDRLRKHCATFEEPYGPLLRALCAVLLGGGLRREEVAKLSADAYNNGQLRVLGKGRKERRLPLPSWARTELEAWLRTRSNLEVNIPECFVRIDRIGRVCNQPMSPWMIWRLVVTTTKNAGIVGISTHDFRRTYLSELLDTTDTATAQKLAGHADPGTTVLYDRRGQRAAEKAMLGLEKWGVPTLPKD